MSYSCFFFYMFLLIFTERAKERDKEKYRQERNIIDQLPSTLLTLGMEPAIRACPGGNQTSEFLVPKSMVNCGVTRAGQFYSCFEWILFIPVVPVFYFCLKSTLSVQNKIHFYFHTIKHTHFKCMVVQLVLTNVYTHVITIIIKI